MHFDFMISSKNKTTPEDEEHKKKNSNVNKYIENIFNYHLSVKCYMSYYTYAGAYPGGIWGFIRKYNKKNVF